MKKLYYLTSALNCDSEEAPSFMRLYDTAAGIYEDPQLQYSVICWAQNSRGEGCFPGLLNELIVTPVEDYLYNFEKNTQDPLYQKTGQFIERAQIEFIKNLICAGVEDERTNRDNFERHVTAVFEHLMEISNQELIVWNEESVDFIKKINELAKARDERIWDEIDEEAELAGYYPETDRADFASLLTRSEYLLSRIAPSEDFVKLMENYRYMYNSFIGKTYELKSEDQFQAPFSFAPSKRDLALYVGDVVVAQGNLTAKNIHVVPPEQAMPTAETMEALLEKHQAVQYTTSLGTVQHAISDRKLLKPLAHERE